MVTFRGLEKHISGSTCVTVRGISWFLFQFWLTHRCVDVCLYVCRVCVCSSRRIILSVRRVVCVRRVGGCLCLFLIVIVGGGGGREEGGGVSLCRANVHVCGVWCVLRVANVSVCLVY